MEPAGASQGKEPRSEAEEEAEQASASQTKCRDPDIDVMADADNLGRAAVTPTWRASSRGRTPPPLHVLVFGSRKGKKDARVQTASAQRPHSVQREPSLVAFLIKSTFRREKKERCILQSGSIMYVGAC